MANRRAHAIAVVKVEISLGSWNAQSTFDALHDQLKREAVEKMQIAMRANGGNVIEVSAIKFVLSEETKADG
jgi:hypothetical protein